MLRTSALVLAALMLTGLTACTQSYVYMRADGRDFAEDQALYQQFETDRMVCQGERHNADSPTTAAYHGAGDMGGRDCMGQKGYIVVQADLADMKRQEIANKAAEKAQREAAAAAPPPPPPAPPKRVAAKPKSKPKEHPDQPAQAQMPSASPAANSPAQRPGQARSAPSAPNWPAPQTPPS